MSGSRTATVVVLLLRAFDLVVQLALIVFGTMFVFDEDEHPDSLLGWLLTWCLLGTLYWILAVLVSYRLAARPLPATGPAADALDRWPVVRFVAGLSTFVASGMGLWAAGILLALRDDEEYGLVVKAVAVWAMLLSWALFHWGYARIYQRIHQRAPDPKPLVFPGTENPRLVDFLYFSFTNATAFSVSDVAVTTTRMRWTVVWHTTLSFFLNALIIVLAINTITSI